MKLKLLSLLMVCMASAIAFADPIVDASGNPIYTCGPYKLTVGPYGLDNKFNSASLDVQCDDLKDFSPSPQGDYYSILSGNCLKDGVSVDVKIDHPNTLLLGAYGTDAGEISVKFSSEQKAHKYTCSYP